MWWLWHECDLFSCQELLHCHIHMTRGIVMMQDPSYLIWSCINTMSQLLYPRERPGSHCIGDWVGTRDGLDGVWKISSLHRGFDPQTIQPVLSRCTDWAIWAHTRNRYKHQTWPASKLPLKFWRENMKLVFSMYGKNFLELPTVSY